MKKYDVVVFDLDSTLVNLEGLDWLAELKGKKYEVARLTKLSMDGQIPVVEAFEKKIAIIAPSYKDLESLGEKYCNSLVEGAFKVIKSLKNAHIEVWIVTGNFNPAVEMVAKKLGVDPVKIICNQVEFDYKGDFKSFDCNQLLANNGGKAKAILGQIKQGRRVVHVGDAITDLETKGIVDLFIGFGGVEIRSVVKNKADFYIEEKNLLPILDLVFR